MAELKTKQNDASVEIFLEQIDDPQKREDSKEICAMMQQVTGEQPKMWGPSIIGFGTYHYVYASGREGDWMMIGFSPRKQALTLYFMDGQYQHSELLKTLGRHSIGKSCLYIKRLSDINKDVLRRMMQDSIANVKAGAIVY